MDTVTTPNAQSPSPAKKKRGCLFYGCLTFSLLALIGLACGGYGIYTAYKFYKNQVEEISDTKPIPLQLESLSDSELTEIQTRVSRFESDSKSELPTPPLALTSREINGLIQSDPRFAPIRGKVRIDVVGSQLHATFSVPLDFLQQQGRYLNGTGAIRLEQGGKGPELYVESVEVHGKALPEPLMERLRTFNLLEQAKEQEQNRDFIKLLERVQIREGKLILFARSSTSL